MDGNGERRFWLEREKGTSQAPGRKRVGYHLRCRGGAGATGAGRELGIREEEKRGKLVGTQKRRKGYQQDSNKSRIWDCWMNVGEPKDDGKRKKKRRRGGGGR